MTVLDGVACKGLAERVTFEQRPEGGEAGGSKLAISGDSSLGRGHGKCKGPVAGLWLARGRKHEKAGVAGESEGERGEDESRKGRNTGHKRPGRSEQGGRCPTEGFKKKNKKEPQSGGWRPASTETRRPVRKLVITQRKADSSGHVVREVRF